MPDRYAGADHDQVHAIEQLRQLQGGGPDDELDTHLPSGGVGAIVGAVVHDDRRATDRQEGCGRRPARHPESDHRDVGHPPPPWATKSA